MSKDLIIACDFPDKTSTLAFLDRFQVQKPYVKIGMELFYGEGPSIVTEIKARGHKVFLDLKLHDIPNTVGSAMRNIARLGVDMTNLHVAGGSAMMKAAMEGLEAGSVNGHRTTLLGVTILTSIDERVMNRELLIPGKISHVVTDYASTAHACGLDGIVCSPLEAHSVKERCGKGFLTVTPGIRYPNDGIGDQSRVTTPEKASQNSDYIVVGRPINAAGDPVFMYHRMLNEFLNPKQ